MAGNCANKSSIPQGTISGQDWQGYAANRWACSYWQGEAKQMISFSSYMIAVKLVNSVYLFVCQKSKVVENQN